MTPEETQALEHLAQERRRVAFQRSLQAKLKGSSAALATLKDKWRPVLNSNRFPKE